MADLDSDGDLDLAVGTGNGTIRYFENTGTSIAPVFVERTGAANPFAGITGSGSDQNVATPSFGDLDEDGDLDLLVGQYGGAVRYFENTGSDTAPAFVERTGSGNPLASVDVGDPGWSAPTTVDINADGNLDIVIGEYDGTINFYKGTNAPVQTVIHVAAEDETPETSPDLSFTGLDSSATFDENTVNATPRIIDGNVSVTNPSDSYDGGKLVVSGLLAEDTVSIHNEGSGAGQIGFAGGNVTYGGTVIGTASGGAGATLTVTFNASATSDAVEALIENLSYGNASDSPTASHALSIYVSDASSDKQFVKESGSANPFNGIDVDSASAPTFGDVDGDGDQDMVLGSNGISLFYYKNTGTDAAPVFVEQTGASNPFSVVTELLRSQLHPDFGDFDADGDLDLMVADAVGDIRFFENTGSATAPVYSFLDIGSISAALPAPTFADLDNDGDLDIIIGQSGGGFTYWRNDGSPTVAQYVVAAAPPGLSGVTISRRLLRARVRRRRSRRRPRPGGWRIQWKGTLFREHGLGHVAELRPADRRRRSFSRRVDWRKYHPGAGRSRR